MGAPTNEANTDIETQTPTAETNKKTSSKQLKVLHTFLCFLLTKSLIKRLCFTSSKR